LDLRSKVITGLKWSAGAKFATQIINWAATIFVMRLLHPDDYGLMAMAGVFIAFCLLLNEMGLGSAIVQVKELTAQMLRQTFGLVIILNFGLFAALFAASPLIARFFDEPRLVTLVPVLSIQFLLMAFFVIPKATLTRKMDFKAISIIESAAALAQGLMTLVLAWRGFGIWALIIGTLFGIALRTIGMNVVDPYLKWPSLNFKGFSQAAKFGGFISLNRILWYLYSKADVMIIGKLLGKTMLGYYSVAMHLASLPLEKVGSIINQIGLPAYSQLQDNREQAAIYAEKASRIISFVAFPVFFGISCVAPELVLLALGDKWLPAVFPLQLLALIVPLKSLSLSLGPAVNGLGRPDINVRNMIAACVVIPVRLLIGVKWGLAGVSIAWVASYTIWFLFMLTQSLPVIGISISRFLASLAGPLFVGGAMYAAVFLARLLIEGWDMGVILSLIALVVVGVSIYVIGIVLFQRNTFREIWALRHNR